MIQALNILFIEDNPLDAELISREIKNGGFNHTSFVADSIQEIEKLLSDQKFDFIISDYSLPGFTGIDIIEFLKNKSLDIPLILVSGTVPDETAIDAVLLGAKDYIMKGNLTRLVPAIKRELEAYQAKKEKDKNELFLDALFNSMLGVRVSDGNRKIIRVNKKYCEMLGYTEAELVGQDLSLVTPSESKESEVEAYNKFLKIGKSEPEKFTEIRKDGSFIDIMSSSTVDRINGETFVISSIQDISDLLLNKSFLEQTSKSAGVGGWEYILANDSLKGSPQVFEIHKMENRREMSPEESISFYHPDDRPILKEAIKDSIKNFKSKDLKLRFKGENGFENWVRITFDPYVVNGRTVKIFGSLRDITKEKEEEILRDKREQRYRFLFENNPNPLMLIDDDGSEVISGVNKAAEALYGYTQSEFVGMTSLNLRPKEDVEHYKKVIQNLANKPDGLGKQVTRSRHLSKNGEVIHVDVNWKRVEFEGKKSRLILINDVTEKAKYEQELIQTNTVLSAIINSAPIGVFTIDNEGKILDVWNAQCEVIFGWKKAEVKGKFLPYAHGKNINEAKGFINEAFKTGETRLYEINRHTKEGRPIVLREYMTPIKGEDEKVEKLMLLIEDISEQKKIELALVNSEKKYRNLVEASRDLIWRIDSEGNFNFINTASNEILGYNPEELLGLSFAPFVAKEQAEEVAQIHSEVMKGRSFDNFDLKLIRKDGKPRFLSAKAYPLKDSRGAIIGCSGTATDITHILEYQEKLEESLKEKEVLIKEIHHRVKNNLAVISGLFSLQALNIDNENVVQIFNESQSRIKSIATIHEKLYQNDLFTSIEIKSYLKDLLEDIQKTFKQNGKEIDIILEGDEVTLNVNQAVPFGILANELITNSFKYAFPNQKKGLITLTLKEKIGEVIFNVKDSGIGLPDDYDRKEQGSLGMYLIHSLADQLNGTILWSTDNGTSFELRFTPTEMNTWADKTYTD